MIRRSLSRCGRYSLAILCASLGLSCGSDRTQSSTSDGASGAAGATSASGTANAAGTAGTGEVSNVAVAPELQPFSDSMASVLIESLERCRATPAAIARSFVADPCAAWLPAISSGRTQFDPTQISTWISDLQALACDADSAPPSCGRVLLGLVKDGASCAMLAQTTFFTGCETGAVWVPSTNGCQGAGVKRAMLTESCGIDQPCAAGATCSVALETCMPKGAADAACG